MKPWLMSQTVALLFDYRCVIATTTITTPPNATSASNSNSNDDDGSDPKNG